MKHPVFLLFVAVLFLALGGIFVRLSEIGAIMTGVYRIALSLPAFVLLHLHQQKKGSLSPRKPLARISRKEFFISMLGGIALGFDLICWHLSFEYTTVANANLLGNMVILINLPVAYFFFKEKIHRSFFIGLVIVFAGLAFLLGGKLEPSVDNFFGDFLAILTAVFYAQYLIVVKVLGRKYSASQVMILLAPSCILVLLIAAFIREAPVFLPETLYGWGILAGVAFISHFIGQGILVNVVAKVKVSLSSLIVLSQPVFGALYAFIFFEELLSWLEIAGIGIIIGGLYIASKKKKIEKS